MSALEKIGLGCGSTLDRIYMDMLENGAYNKRLEGIYHDFADKYIYTRYGNDKGNEVYGELSAIISEWEEAGFMKGFRAAMSLLMDCGAKVVVAYE